MRLDGKRAVVTGGASGIGRATAVRLVSEGAEVWVGDLDSARGEALVEEAGGRIHFLRTDVTEAEQIEALMHAPETLDIAFNNAGAVGSRLRIDEMTADDWDRTQRLLLRSVALGIRHAAPRMAAQGGGSIVNTSSVSALGTGYAPIAYSTAKAGVLHLTKLAAADLAQSRVRVNAVVPGFIATSIFSRAIDVPEEKMAVVDQAVAGIAAGAQPVQRAGRPEDIAAAVAYLASDDAAFVTGTHILVDGGLTIGTRASWDPQAPSLFAALEAFQ